MKKSNVGGAGDGLFARIDIETNTVVAFYNGRRVRPKVNCPNSYCILNVVSFFKFEKRVSWKNCQTSATDSINPHNLVRCIELLKRAFLNNIINNKNPKRISKNNNISIFQDWNAREHETWEDNAYKIFDPNDKKFTIDIPKVGI